VGEFSPGRLLVPLLLDTHAAIWYFSDSDELSVTARNEIEAAVQRAEDVFLASISLVEVIYLAEKGRLPAEALAKLEHALAEGKSSVIVAPLDSAVAASVGRISRVAVPDMPDRIIAATALQLGVPLVTRDRRIRGAGIDTIW